MKTFITTIALAALFAIPTQAQVNTVSSNFRRVDTDFIRPDTEGKVKAEGIPFINEEFVLAKINNDNKLYAVRYDGYQDLIEVQENEDAKPLLLDKNKEYIIKLNDGSKVYQTVTYPNGKRGFAVYVWSDEKNNGLYIKEKVKFTPIKQSTSGYQSDTPAKFSRVSDLYYIKDAKTGSLVELSKSKKKFYAAFGSKAKQVQQFTKKAKLKINKKEDLIKIIRFYFAT